MNECRWIQDPIQLLSQFNFCNGKKTNLNQNLAINVSLLFVICKEKNDYSNYI